MNKQTILAQIKHGLIVSCQSEPPEPFATPELLVAMARAAIMGGARAIRANLPHNVSAIVNAVDVPVIGLYKKIYPGNEVYITPTRTEAAALIETGVPVIALDATSRNRPQGETLAELVNYIRDHSPAMLMADISDYDEGIKAAELGFDLVGTTLSGYTASSQKDGEAADHPDFDLVEKLASALKEDVPVIAEGRIWEPRQARKCLDLGAFATVVGTAITRPWVVTRRFVDAIDA